MSQNFLTTPLNLISDSKKDSSLNLPAGEINKLISNSDDGLNKQVTADEFNFQRHTGTDAQQIDPKNLLGWRIFRTAPTFPAPEGTQVLYWDGMATYRVYFRINKSWRYATLT